MECVPPEYRLAAARPDDQGIYGRERQVSRGTPTAAAAPLPPRATPDNEARPTAQASLGDAGQPLLDDRAALLGALSSLDKAIYLKQTGRGGAGDEAAMLSDVEKALKALDAIIAKL